MRLCGDGFHSSSDRVSGGHVEEEQMDIGAGGEGRFDSGEVAGSSKDGEPFVGEGGGKCSANGAGGGACYEYRLYGRVHGPDEVADEEEPGDRGKSEEVYVGNQRTKNKPNSDVGYSNGSQEESTWSYPVSLIISIIHESRCTCWALKDRVGHYCPFLISASFQLQPIDTAK